MAATWLMSAKYLPPEAAARSFKGWSHQMCLTLSPVARSHQSWVLMA